MQISDVVSYVKESQAEINPAVLKTVLQRFEEKLKLEVFDFGDFDYKSGERTVLPVDPMISERLSEIFENRAPIIMQGRLIWHYEDESADPDITEFSCVANVLFQPNPLFKAWCAVPLPYDASTCFLLMETEGSWYIMLGDDVQSAMH